MPKSSTFPFRLRPNHSSSGGGGRRLAASIAAFGAVALLAGVLQTASATSVSQVLGNETTTTLTADINPSVVGETVTYTANVKTTDAVLGVPVTAGTVDFTETIGDVETALCQDVELNTSGEFACAETHSTAEARTIKAYYSGDETANYAPSNGSHEQTVDKAPTTTTLASSSNPSVVGEVVTFTATVTATRGTGTPEGQVTFQEAGVETALCTVSLEEGKATCQQTYTTPTPPDTTHTVTATYAGNSNYEASPETPEQTVAQTVNKANTTTTLSSDQPENTATVSGEPVMYTATVAVVSPGAGTPGGTVKFQQTSEGTTIDISTCTLRTVSATGTAQCETKFMAKGSPHSVTAVYSGNDYFNTSDNTGSPISQTVNQAKTTTAVSSGNNPSNPGESVTYTAVVMTTAPGTGFPDGTVAFKDGATVFCTDTLENGQAKCTATYNTTGDRRISAEYLGSDNYVGSTSAVITQVVEHAYSVVAQANSTSDPTNASFTIRSLSGAPRLANYKLCVKYLRFDADTEWPAVTPPPIASHTGIHRFGINLSNKCKTKSWSSGTSHTDNLMDTSLGSDDFGFATKGIYEVSWYKTNGELVGKDLFTWNSWCPPNVGGFRQMGVWRTSRHKVRDSCATSTGNSGGLTSHFDKDRSLSWNGHHNEFVARDYLRSYGAPSKGAIGVGGHGYATGWHRYVGVYLCDRYHHGKSEYHPIFMAQKAGGRIFLGGPQYSTATPSISGTWRVYSC